jgi:hypothetical protein
LIGSKEQAESGNLARIRKVSTDYLELYIQMAGAGTLTAGAASGTTNFMSGFLARGV